MLSLMMRLGLCEFFSRWIGDYIEASVNHVYAWCCEVGVSHVQVLEQLPGSIATLPRITEDT